MAREGRLTSCDTVVGCRLVDRQGAFLGTLAELVMDLDSDRVAYGLVSRQRGSCDEEELVAIPWSALRLDTDRGLLELAVDRGSFDGASGFHPEERPDFTDRRWEKVVLARFSPGE